MHTSTGKGEPSASARELPVWDRAGMMERLLDDEELAREISEGFVADTAERLGALKALLEAGDAPAAGREAHTIKGSSANVGGERVRSVALEMEVSLQRGDLAAAATRVGALEEEFERLREAIGA